MLVIPLFVSIPRTAVKWFPFFRLLFTLGSMGLFACAGANAADLYAGMAIGGNASPDVTVASRSNDRASICDEYINPGALAIPGCTAPNRGAGDGWLAPFGSGGGFSAEAELGFRFSPRFRAAVSYAYNATRFDQTVSSTDASGADFDKIGNELSVGEETLGTANSHELFLAAYRDWPNASRWTPWAGVGVGVAWARKDFSWVWARSANPADILTGAGQPNAAEIRSNLSGTVSTGRAVLKDRMTGYLVATGIDRALTESLALGLELQWKIFGDFESGAYQGALLRSHAPNLRLDGSEPVNTWSGTNDAARASLMLSIPQSPDTDLEWGFLTWLVYYGWAGVDSRAQARGRIDLIAVRNWPRTVHFTLSGTPDSVVPTSESPPSRTNISTSRSPVTFATVNAAAARGGPLGSLVASLSAGNGALSDLDALSVFAGVGPEIVGHEPILPRIGHASFLA